MMIYYATRVLIYIYIYLCKKNALTAGGRKTIECLTFSRVRHMY